MNDFHEKKDGQETSPSVYNKINSIELSLVEMRKDIQHISSKVDPDLFHYLLEQMEYLIREQNEQLSKEKSHFTSMKEEITQLKSQIAHQQKEKETKQPRRSEYRQLQSMLQSSRYHDPSHLHQHHQLPERQSFHYGRQSPQVPQQPSPGRTYSGDKNRRSFKQNQSQVNKNIITSKRQAGQNFKPIR